MSHLFDPLTIRDVEFVNHVFVSPMCQYSSTDGLPNDWRLLNLGSRAVGRAELVISEATTVRLECLISPPDLAIWAGDQVERSLRDQVRSNPRELNVHRHIGKCGYE